MLIRFSNSNRGGVLTCVRANGRSTWMVLKQTAFFRRHDLLHYAVETTMGLRDSFYGLVAAGWNLEDFSKPGVAERLPAEAIQTEYVVNFLAARWDDRAHLTAEELNEHLELTSRAAGQNPVSPPYPISAEMLFLLLKSGEELFAQAECLADGEVLELPFA